METEEKKDFFHTYCYDCEHKSKFPHYRTEAYHKKKKKEYFTCELHGIEISEKSETCSDGTNSLPIGYRAKILNQFETIQSSDGWDDY